MAATVVIKESNGAGPTDTTVTAIKLCTADVVNPGSAYTLKRPPAGSDNYSYAKSISLFAETTPNGTINNVTFFTPGDIAWTGVTLMVGTSDTYYEASGTENVTGNYNSFATTDANDYTSSSPLSVTGELVFPNVGRICDYIILQAVIDETAAPGALDSETITITYDET